MVVGRRMALRLNPFVFPSDTDFRFVLLIISVLGSSLLIYKALYNSLPAHTAPLRSSQNAWVIGGVVLLLVVAAVIYWAFPVWKMRRDKLEPLEAEDAPEIVTYLAELCREAGLPSPPLFVVNPLNPTSTGLAFGRLGRYYIVLNAGLVTRFSKDRPAFRAVLLHELAHLRNADVDKTYFSLAIALAFLIAAVVPLAISRLGRPLGETFDMGWRVLALGMLVYLTLSAVLRAREVYADVRASVWDGLAGGLSRMLKSLPQPKGGRWGRYVAFHPDPCDRRQALNDTQYLFRMGFWEAFGTGIAATIAFQNVGDIVPTSVPIFSTLGAGLIFAPLIVGGVGSGIWRAALAALVGRTMPRGTGRLALGLGLGLLLGQYLSLATFALSTSTFALTGLNLFVFDVLWIGVVLISSWFFLYWIAAGAWTWMEVAVARALLQKVQ
jgi:Zn-dependent protease with chaperone function